MLTNLRTILVPMDFYEGSLAALRHARELAAVFNGHIHLLHVSSSPDAPAWAKELFRDEWRPLVTQDRTRALDRLATLIVMERLDPRTTTGLVRTGYAEQAIAEYASQIDADLIVMGTRGEHPALSVGHVAERVLGLVHCPVLMIPEEPGGVAASPRIDTLESAVAC